MNIYTLIDPTIYYKWKQGEIADVSGTVFDLRTPTRLGDVIDDNMLTLGGFDHNFCIRGPTGKRFAAKLVF